MNDLPATSDASDQAAIDGASRGAVDGASVADGMAQTAALGLQGVTKAAALAGFGLPHVPHRPDDLPPPPDAPPVIPPDPAFTPAMAAPAAPGLLYYAVYLPTPTGLPAGPPLYLPAPGMGGPGAAFPAPAGGPVPLYPVTGPVPPGSQAALAQAHNQRLLVIGIILVVFVVHLPWLVYLFAVHACWGNFLETCFAQGPAAADALTDPFADPFADGTGAPMLFARVVFLMLRVQAVLAGDWGQFSQAMQVSTGAGSFVLTRIVAANGLVAEGRLQVWLLAASAALAFGLLFWVELHLFGTETYPDLGALTVLGYIDQNLPVDFLAYSTVESSLRGYLQFLRLADALILGAALAMPTTRKSA